MDFSNVLKKHQPEVLQTMTETVAAENMIGAGESVLVGVSGGVDSVVLLFCLVELAEEIGIRRLGVAHLNHGIRGAAAEQDRQFVRALADEYGLDCYSQAVDVKHRARRDRLSLEAAARQARYGFLEKTADGEGFHKIATAHHADDNAEQVLMNVIRGSGPAGLAGIPPMREDRIIRPLIRVSRAAIEALAREKNLSFTFDYTNDDTAFLRNRVRHRLMPLLQKEYNPNIKAGLNKMAQVFQAEEDWHKAYLSGIYENMRLSTADDKIVVSAPALKKQPLAVRRRLIKKMLRNLQGHGRRISFDHVEAVIDCLSKSRHFSLDLPGGIVMAGEEDRLTAKLSSSESKNSSDHPPAFFYRIFDHSPKDAVLPIPEIHQRLEFSVLPAAAVEEPLTGRGDTTFFDADSLSCPLFVRNVRPGDHFTPLGMRGTQKIKDYFINNKIPRRQRVLCPVLLAGDVIIWLAGHRMAEDAKITSGTRTVLKAELVPG